MQVARRDTGKHGQWINDGTRLRIIRPEHVKQLREREILITKKKIRCELLDEVVGAKELFKEIDLFISCNTEDELGLISDMLSSIKSLIEYQCWGRLDAD